MNPRCNTTSLLVLASLLLAFSSSVSAQDFQAKYSAYSSSVDGAYAMPDKNTSGSETPDAPSSLYSSSKTHGEVESTTVMLGQENWRPLTTKEKFASTKNDLLCPFTQMSLLAGAKVSQMTNDRPYLGPRFPGFAKRYGLDLADTANVDFIQGSLLPWAFHEDPRYIPLDAGSKKRRLFYAVSRVVITRKDSGRDGFNNSKVLGAFASSGISNLYYPGERGNGAGATFSRAGIGLGSDAAMNVLKEFWPDVARKVKLKVWMSNLIERTLRSALTDN